MESPEVPIEQTQEDLHHHAEHSHEPWIMGVALTAAVLAVLAAITALLAEHNANEALLEEIESADQWGYYQAKSIKSNVVATKIDILEALGKPVPEKDRKKIAQYEKEQGEIRDRAEKKKARSEQFLGVHTVLSRGVTLFQIAIAVGAISVLTRRKSLWLAAIVFGAVGTVILIWGLIASTAIPGPVSETAEAVLFSPAEPGAQEYRDSRGEKWLQNHPRIGSHWLAKRPV
ncbi:MAG: DUF4337 domain-containing protein [Thermoguttaceae bacterium]|jgi:pyruvate/2-oxoglutarate dehydrogenase complex dihydrolipoamide acyltransferase (E2) component